MRTMAPADEVFGGIAMHFQRLNTRCCDEFWAGGGGYGYHSQTGGVVRECLVRLLEILWKNRRTTFELSPIALVESWRWILVLEMRKSAKN